jgi:ankyrin repeat protein
VTRLLDAGADVNAQGFFGSALQVASRQGHLNVVELLLRSEAKVNYDEDPAATHSLTYSSNGNEGLS